MERMPLMRNTSAENNKGWTTVLWVLKAVAMLMALDFMIVFLTVLKYWEHVGGTLSTYGLVFSTYSIAQFIFIPFVSEWLDKHPMKTMLIITIGINIIGNVLYMAGASVHNDHVAQALVVIGRFVAGIGAANIVTGPFYIVTNTRDVEERAGQLASFNFFGFIGRTAGPILAFIIMGSAPKTSEGGFVLNQYSYPPFLTSILAIVIIGGVFYFMNSENDPAPARTSHPHLRGGGELKKELALFYIFHVFILIIFWSWYSNITIFGGVQFQMGNGYCTDDNSWIWNIYLPILVGFIVGTYTFKFLVGKFKMPIIYLLYLAPLLMIGGFVVMLDINNDDTAVRYWIGCILLSVGFNIESASVPALYSGMIEATGNEPIMARLLGILTLFTCIGRSVGPIWPSLVMKIVAVGPDSSCCDQAVSNYSGSSSGSGNPNCNTCCQLKGANTVLIVCIAGLGVLFLFLIGLIRPIILKYARDSKK
eukprot:TRINITY_DN2409_c0_g1_i1.p1 TRINITY_DN2409_c0_g1~~TRINITY_DN2409_c0_g1_i1.p1  ORF type:complete len:478 (+),score=111.75 TRINITY_DN2409_c0_g1_i1:153-1586(+)